MENMSDLYHNQYEAWKWDQLNPDERLWVGRASLRRTPTWLMSVPDHLKAPEQLTEREREEREDDFLRKHGVK